ncbi:acyl carrier protein (ACP1) [Klebsiella michiganensis]|nr:acyl carrier protein (ACP1) [Klebsiella michiganensis]
MQALYLEIKNLIINTLNLDELSVDDIETEAALFGDGLGLDSIDALELGLAVKNQYGVALSAESEEMRQHFFLRCHAGIFHSRATYLRRRRYDRTKRHLRRSLRAAD